MRYLIFGDVHGNLPALEKLLHIEKNNYDQLISHGDVVNYGPWSNECVDFLSTVPEVVTLQGNHEENFLTGQYSGTHPVAATFFEFCYPEFSRHRLIEDYGEFYDVGEYRVQHTVDGTYFYPDSDLSGYRLERNYVIGHSHYQFDRSAGTKRFINTGSVGQNRKFIDVAEYVLYDEGTNEIELRHFVYNVDYVIEKMENRGYPELCINYYRNKKRFE